MTTRTYLDGHACAMETKRKQNSLSFQTLITNREFDFGKGKGVTQMHSSVHVRIRKRSHIFWANNFISVNLEHFFILPLFLNRFFDFSQKVSLGATFALFRYYKFLQTNLFFLFPFL